MTSTANRPPLKSLACISPDCDLHAQPEQNNLTIRKVYGADRIRYLRCTHCGEEFSERKLTALFNCKIPEQRAIQISQQLAEGTSIKGTARLTQTNPDTVRRLALKLGRHSERFHDQHAQNLKVNVLEMDERHGYAQSKERQHWDAVTIDPNSKFVLQVEVGPRNETLIQRLMQRSAKRLFNRHDLALMTDGEGCYRTLFAQTFGVSYSPPAQVKEGDPVPPNIGSLAR